MRYGTLKFSVLCCCLFVASFLGAQDDFVLTNCADDYELAPERYTVKLTDVMPAWKGCETIEYGANREKCTGEKMAEYIKDNVVYPERAKDMYLEGIVWIHCVVQENGCLSDIRISESLGGHTGWEAQKVVRGMPAWIPGFKTGFYVPVEVTIPVKFEMPK